MSIRLDCHGVRVDCVLPCKVPEKFKGKKVNFIQDDKMGEGFHYSLIGKYIIFFGISMI